MTWSISPNLGTITGGATSALYKAPANATAGQTVQVTASTVATPSVSVKSVINLIPAITVTVNPSGLDLMGPAQQAFTAAMLGAQNSAVTWTASPGTITATGVYTAPAVAADTVATITATSVADPTKSGSATVRLHSKTGLWFSTQINGLQHLYFGGVDYNYLYGENLVTSVTMALPNGQAHLTPVCAGSFTANSVTKHCPTAGSDSMDVTVTFSTPPPAPGVSTAPGTFVGTIEADVQIKNNSQTTTVSQAMLSILGISMAQFNGALSRPIALDPTNPLAYVNYGAGQWALWNNVPTADITTNMACGWAYVCKNQPIIANIAPGQTKLASFTMRFTNDVTASSLNLAPEAYADFRAVYPSIVNWPDRRPIMAWFVADHGHQSVTNPRGYLFDPTLDASNITGFSARMVAQAQGILNQIKSRPVQPQGVVIWDLEGEEFIQPTTYVGDPRVLGEGYAPEMNAAADQVFAVFKNAGLKVGVTLRPQSLQWGKTLPATCNYNANNDFKDYYIRVDQPFGAKFYACYDPAGKAWSLIPQGNGGQTFYTQNQEAQLIALMMAKVQYAHSRWGATLYYVDTSVWDGGAPLPQDVFRALQQAYPDCLFIPEENYAATMGVAMPFADPKNPGAAKFAPASWRYIYPTGALGIYLSNCLSDWNCWNANNASFDTGQKVGDIAMYAVPTQMSPAQYSSVEAMINQARTEAGSVTVTDSTSGAHFSYRGSPSTVFQYPLKMRVYFAANAAALPASATYCESGGWQGENTCTLNLAGLVTAQIRYYNFNNQLVISEPAQAR